MKAHLFSMLIPLVALCGTVSVALQQQQGDYPRAVHPREAEFESRQGRPGEPDVISHKHVLKGTGLECIQVEHYPKRVDDGAACLLKFEGGDKYTLRHGESMQAPKDGEVYLECPGDKPTRCTVGVW